MHSMDMERFVGGGADSAGPIGVQTAGGGLRIATWLATGAFAALMMLSGVLFVLGPAPVVQGIGHLGYPRYFTVLIGLAKLLGVGALLAPRARVLREWAYAGFTFVLIGAVLSHLLSGDGPARAAPAAVSLGLLLASYFLRRHVARAFGSGAHPVPATGEGPGGFWRVAPWLSRAALLPPTVIFAVIAARYLSNPVGAAATVGISLATPEAITVARVAFGALPLAFSLFLAASMLSPRRLLAGLALVTTLVALATLVRVFGISVEGAAGDSVKLLRAEVVLLTLSVAGLAIEWRRGHRLGHA